MNSKNNTGVIAIVVGVLLLAGFFLFREWRPGTYGYGYGGHMMLGTGVWGMGGLMLVFWGLILLGLILMINWLLTVNRNEKSAGNGTCDALDILKSRYARGEIDLAQYQQMREELTR